MESAEPSIQALPRIRREGVDLCLCKDERVINPAPYSPYSDGTTITQVFEIRIRKSLHSQTVNICANLFENFEAKALPWSRKAQIIIVTENELLTGPK